MDVVFSVRAKLRRGVARLHEMVLQVSVTKYFDLIFFFAIVVSSPSTEALYLAAFSAARPQVDHTLQSSRGGLGTHSRPNPAVQLVGVLQGRPLVFELGMVGVARGNKIDHTKGGETCQIAPESFMMSASSGVGRMRSRCQARDWKGVRAWTAFMSGQGRMPL